MADPIDITLLSTADLLELLQEDLYDGYEREVAATVQELLTRGTPAEEVLARGLITGMEIVGIDFRDGLIFVPEVLMAARAMKAGLALLRPLLAETSAPKAGRILLGTVKGDIHDIGKSLVGMMLEGAGFEVIDLGIDLAAERFVAAVREHRPDFLGLSALLTTTMPYIATVIDALEEAGLRQQVKVLVGGAPLNEALARQYGADAYGADAAQAVTIAQHLRRSH